MPGRPLASEVSSTPVEASLTINEAWQLLQGHTNYLSDRTDINAFCKGLRDVAQFDGTELVFPKEGVMSLIERAIKGT
jgi:hypothetical protein